MQGEVRQPFGLNDFCDLFERNTAGMRKWGESTSREGRGGGEGVSVLAASFPCTVIIISFPCTVSIMLFLCIFTILPTLILPSPSTPCLPLGLDETSPTNKGDKGLKKMLSSASNTVHSLRDSCSEKAPFTREGEREGGRGEERAKASAWSLPSPAVFTLYTAHWKRTN